MDDVFRGGQGKLPWVQRIPQGITERVAGEHGDHDGEPGEHGEPPQVRYTFRAVLDDASPRCRWRTHADAEVREAGLEQYDVAYGEGGVHQTGPDDVGQHVPEHDAPWRRAERARGDDVLTSPRA